MRRDGSDDPHELAAASSEAVAPARVAILGLGLMGGSLGMALRTLGHRVAGYDAAPGVAERAVALGATDIAYGSVAEAVMGAELVVLAAPVMAMRELFETIAPHISPRAVVTDLGSTKAQVTRWAGGLLPHPGRFVGGHPMTGSERVGVESARPDLYRGCLWCVTPTESTAPEAVQRVIGLVETLGARPHVIDPERHDAAVALVSHLPLIAATGLMLAASSTPAWDDARSLAAGGWRDTTRVASGSPRMARDICLSNRDSILAALDAYLVTLRDLRERIAEGDAAIEECFAAAKRERDAWMRDQRHVEG